jgi:hypothetical protein
MKHLEVIAAAPRPTGSPELAFVRSYLVGEIKKLGLDPKVHKAQVMRQWSGHYLRAATVENIAVRLPGTAKGQALLLMSHYDSVPNSYGATDDGSGVVTLLETMRAMTTLPPLKNDVIFLFTDGEELLLLGAKAFVEQHPWMEDVKLAMNFEGSGSRGPVFLFETSPKNSRLIREFARAAPYPLGNSLMYEIYRRLPNDTDLTEFKKAGRAGLNFAYLDSPFDYHSANDNLKNIDERSIQHHGSYALALARHFGNISLAGEGSADSIFFNTIGFGFVHYPGKWGVVVVAAAWLLFMAVSARGLRAGRMKIQGVFFGLIAFLAALTVVPLAMKGLLAVIRTFYEGPRWWLLFYHQKSLLIGFVSLSLALLWVLFQLFQKGFKVWHGAALFAGINLLLHFGGLFRWTSLASSLAACGILVLMFRRGTGVWHLTMGSLFAWLVLVTAGTVMLPGGSYFAWLPAFGLIPVARVFFSKHTSNLSFETRALFFIASMPALLWLSSIVYLFFIASGLDQIRVVAALVVLTAGLLVPHFDFISRVTGRVLPGALFILGVAFLIRGTIGANFDERHKRPNCVFYVESADAPSSFWASTDLKPDRWTANYLTQKPDAGAMAEFLPGSAATIIRAEAPPSRLPAPELALIEDTTKDDVRTLKMLLKSARQAPILHILLSPNTPLVGAELNGMAVDGLEVSGQASAGNWRRWLYYALPFEGITLTLRLVPARPVEIRLTDISYGLPELPGFHPEPRPSSMMPMPYTYSDMTLVTKTILLDQEK